HAVAANRQRWAHARAGRWRSRAVPDRLRRDEEVPDRRLPGGSAREPRVRHTQALLLGRGARGAVRLRVPVILRLLRLHGHRSRIRLAYRNQAAAELPPPLLGRQRGRLLAALAHLVFELAARLHLLLASRSEIALEGACVPEPGRHDGDRRI